MEEKEFIWKTYNETLKGRSTFTASSSKDVDTAEERATARNAFAEKYELSGGVESSKLTAASRFPIDTNLVIGNKTILFNDSRSNGSHLMKCM